jgi:cob(I)alamin adenosyltransferase
VHGSEGTTLKIYTKTGDNGETGLFGGPRVPKDDIRIEAYGTVDELNAFLGAARIEPLPAEVDAVLVRVQNCLFTIGAELATPNPVRQATSPIGDPAIEELERAIDQMEQSLPPLKEFILPGGGPAAAALHIARSVCRRAERRVVTLWRSPGATVSEAAVRYLNRLSDYLFVAARYCNHTAGLADVPWRKDEPGTS